MASLHNSPTVHRTLFSTTSSHPQMVSHRRGRTVQFRVRAHEASPSPPPPALDCCKRRLMLIGIGALTTSLPQKDLHLLKKYQRSIKLLWTL
ncbi:photosynthetic NDH subunit of lumenal location 1, chloroplastic [Iris pallida]|uniref:Photosynthetic NDH subunit of lumenal location 1, chloroplastic n=1 Tax=Iris pallida TaxID=29817 RepID=A0AAX6EXJ3_IRIPA|nr:photosynthetic NDH subunit of lumenal location 1, chloroplastic [Iris pallida]